MSELSKEIRHVKYNDGVHVAFYEDGELFYRAQVRESGHSMGMQNGDGITVGGPKDYYVSMVVAVVKKMVWGAESERLYDSIALCLPDE